jgi:hypothetical protein
VTAKKREPSHGTPREAKSLPQRDTHAENARFQLSASLAGHEPAAEDKRQVREEEALGNPSGSSNVHENTGG